MDIREHVSLAEVTSLAIGGPARYCLTIEQGSEAAEAISFATSRSLRWTVLGAGNSTLAADHGFDGVVIRCAGVERQACPSGALIFAGDRCGSLGSIGAAAISGTIPLLDIAEFHWVNEQGIAQVIPADRWSATALQHSPGLVLGVVLKHDLQPPAPILHPPLPSAQVFQPQRGTAVSAIADVGWAGKPLGKACLWAEDPTWMTVQPGAKADDVVQLMSLVKQQVRDTLGIQLRDAISYLGM